MSTSVSQPGVPWPNAISDESALVRPAESLREDTSLFSWIFAWILLLPLLYLLVEGITSFQTGGNSGYGGLEQDQQFLQTGAVSIVARLVSAVVWAICAYAVMTRLRQVLRLAWEMKAISALALFAVISCLWSQDPLLTFFKSGLLVAGTLFAYYLSERLTPNRMMQLLFLLGSLALIASILVSVAVPTAGVDIAGAWRGIFNHKNRLSRAALLLIPPALSMRVTGLLHIIRILYVLMSLAVIGMSQSRTGWLITAAFFAFYYLLGWFARMRKQDLLTTILLVSGTLGYAGITIYSNLAAITGALGKDATLSGRTEIWRAAIASGLKQPIVGFGFGAFWRGVKGESLNIFLSTGFALWQGHNAYLDIWLDLGVVGLGLFLATFIFACRDGFVCLRPNRPPEIDWYISTIFIVISLGMTQGQLLLHNSLVILLYFICCIGLRKARKAMTSQNALSV